MTRENEILINIAHRTWVFVNDNIRANFQKYINIAVADPGFPRRGMSGPPTPEFGPKTYYLARFLHANERNWTERGARVPSAPSWIRQCIGFLTSSNLVSRNYL